jgi:adenylate cyclase
LRLLPNIRYGTERFPEKDARRLRAVNITAWIAAGVATVFAVVQFLDPTPGLWRLGAINALDAAVWAAIPLLHRFGTLAASIAFGISVFVSNFVISVLLGTGAGVHLYYWPATALVILFFGTERIYLASAFVVVAAALVVVLHIYVPPNTGLVTEQMLFGNFVASVVASSAILFAIVFYTVRQIARAELAAEREFERSEMLLSNILPPRVAGRLKRRTKSVIADSYPEASILFADMAGFTARTSDTSPDELVKFLNVVFSEFDRLVERHGLEKIKTTGDAYMVVSGVPHVRADHAEALAELALDMRDAAAGFVDPKGRKVPVRIGIASGPVVAGVVGTRKFFYDVWGDAVNTASRMESTGEAGKIQVAPASYERLKDSFDLESRGISEIRGKGRMQTWFLLGRRAGAEPLRTAPKASKPVA